jgi:hypothetical protein
MENVIAILHGEIHYVAFYLLAVTHALGLLLGIGGHLHLVLLDIAVPELAAGPRDILKTYNLTVVNHFTVHDVIGGKDVIIFHDVLVAVVVLDILALPVMRRIDVNPAVEDMD